jgi:hypothetical protein
VWHRLRRLLLQRLGEADQIDWSRASLHGLERPRPKWGAFLICSFWLVDNLW